MIDGAIEVRLPYTWIYLVARGRGDELLYLTAQALKRSKAVWDSPHELVRVLFCQLMLEHNEVAQLQGLEIHGFELNELIPIPVSVDPMIKTVWTETHGKMSYEKFIRVVG